MSELTLYHNPRCSKSRSALALLEENVITPPVVSYLDQPPDREELEELLRKLGMGIRDLLRQGEAEYKQYQLGDSSLSNDIVFEIVAKHPRLVERPIIVCGERVVIDRPPQRVLDLLED
ncbi:MAG: arsenate reductase (glutaredoxin) [Gammaproteobacteria bacterium]|mgnify:CR=1 FL=1|nr:arsenate reductase (glutaredoxin) [Gammaproteobacteria bacterium]|tara:strand:- start:435 stop:791 length:357 start_codon:yes stop_codon:yes gene_type:complete